MMNKISKWKPLVYLVCLSTLVILLLDQKGILDKNKIDGMVLLAGNFILFIATAVSFYVYLRSLHSVTPGAAVRGMYGSFMIKFFVCLIAAFAYMLFEKKNVNKPALIICMGLYIVYTIIEVTSLQKLLKQKKNEIASTQ
jgi:hypothetical protein